MDGHFLALNFFAYPGEAMSVSDIFKRIFGTSHQRMMRKIHPIIVQINDMESQISSLSDEDLKAQTPKFKQMLENGASLDDILPEAFATVRETGKRVLNMRHYDVQLIGGVVLHRGMISEMKTGEGKTLVATTPMYLNALSGKGAHLVTVNDYLASRDADWMGQIYKFLGLSVGKILTDMDNNERRDAYNCDITYGTNNEFGFDYLRDNMKYQLSDYVQRGHNYAIVDEVDSILIDEARTPLIISGQMEQDLNLYKEINKLVPFLKRDEDYTVDEKAQSVALNESGIEKLEKHLNIENIYEPKYIEYLHHVNKALQAHTLYKLDQNYVIENGKIVIIDDFTGRMMHGRRWSDGLHQAIEAKEGVEIQAESQTLATITFQNYFRMYEKLAGMTGTADTEAEEFKKIYKLEVVSIPTAKKIIRKDYQDVIYFNEKAKIAAIAEQIKTCHEKGQPILVGTVSVEKSEVFSKAIQRLGIEHNVLNAKNHKREAEIIAQAGRKGAVTIATNMAGRGTDILLGGNPEYLARQEVGSESDPRYAERLAYYKELCAKEKVEVQDAGGLFILGTERHESRRIDNQLRGRAGRQGDPGASRFFLSLDDDLLRIFGGEELKNRMAMFGMEKQADIPIEAGIVSKSIERAQKNVEGRNFDIRKNLLEYDDVMNSQRKSIYELRSKVLAGENLEDEVLDAFEAIVYSLADEYMPPELAYEDWNMDAIVKSLDGIFGYKFDIDVSGIGRADRDARISLIWDKIEAHYKDQVSKFDEIAKAMEENLGDNNPYKGQHGVDLLMELAQNYYLREIDHFWRAHLTAMTGLRESISLRGYAQKDPKQEYKREAYTLFEKMMRNIKTRMMTQVCRVKPEMPDFSRLGVKKPAAQTKPQQAVQAPKADDKQVNELKAMAAETKKKSGSPSMAELMAIAQKPKQEEKKAETPKRPLSLAELMPVSIADAAKLQRQEAEAPKKPMSMADLMPLSLTNAMNEAKEAQRRMMERMQEEAEEAEEAEEEPEEDISITMGTPAAEAEVEDEESEVEDEESMETASFEDEPYVIRAGESDDESETAKADDENETAKADDENETAKADDAVEAKADDAVEAKADDATEANANDAQAPAPKEEMAGFTLNRPAKKDDDLASLFGSSSLSNGLDLDGLDDFDDFAPAGSDMDKLKSPSMPTLTNDLLSGLDDSMDSETDSEASSTEEDSDPFGIFKNLGL